ncbi:MAG: hypothetical protein CL424_10395 [Acidimicrobiaceae bacterium]|nr:hypothetical protein [Acidimicrobiaceae bacterium]
MGSIVAAEVSEPCPTSAEFERGDGSEQIAEASRLEPMLGQVLAYGSDHPDVFGSYGLVWHGVGDASVFASFTGDLDPYRDALESAVEFPDELIVCQVPISGRDAQALETTLVAELSGRFLSIGRGSSGFVDVAVRADEIDLARELKERYGDAINLRVGALAYPIESAEDVCTGPPAERNLHGLMIEVVAPSESVVPDDWSSLGLTVTLTNVGSEPIQFSSGAARGVVLGDDRTVVNADVLEQPAVEEWIDLEPGASTGLPLTVSAASCNPELGYRLPPGEYDVVGVIPHPDGEVTSASTTISVGG